MITLNDSNFKSETSSWLILVDFWADWCGPCKMMLPILEELSKMIWDKAKIWKLNVDENPTISAEFRILSIPTLLIFKDWKLVDQMLWVKQASVLKEKLESYI